MLRISNFGTNWALRPVCGPAPCSGQVGTVDVTANMTLYIRLPGACKYWIDECICSSCLDFSRYSGHILQVKWIDRFTIFWCEIFLRIRASKISQIDLILAKLIRTQRVAAFLGTLSRPTRLALPQGSLICYWRSHIANCWNHVRL